MLRAIGYLSSATTRFTRAELIGLTTQSRSLNHFGAITGMLCYDDGSFMQFLEGEHEDLDRVFDAISRDARHKALVKIYEEPLTARLFPDWTMAVRRREDLSPEQQDVWRDLAHVAIPGADARDYRQMVEIFLHTFRQRARA